MIFQMKMISSYIKMIFMIFMELFPCTNGSLLERIENHKKTDGRQQENQS